MNRSTVVKILGERVEQPSLRACAIQNDVEPFFELTCVLAERRLVRERALRYMSWPSQVCIDGAGILLGGERIGKRGKRVCRRSGRFRNYREVVVERGGGEQRF